MYVFLMRMLFYHNNMHMQIDRCTYYSRYLCILIIKIKKTNKNVDSIAASVSFRCYQFKCKNKKCNDLLLKVIHTKYIFPYIFAQFTINKLHSYKINIVKYIVHRCQKINASMAVSKKKLYMYISVCTQCFLKKNAYFLSCFIALLSIVV